MAAVVLTSMLKRVDVASTLHQVLSTRHVLTGVQLFDLKKDGVGYSKSNPAVEPYGARTTRLQAADIIGAVTVPDYARLIASAR